jgi:hypothetical protein
MFVNHKSSIAWKWPIIGALILILGVVACQPGAQTSDAPALASASPVAPTDVDRSNPPSTTPPTAALPAPTSTEVQPSPSDGGQVPPVTSPTGMPHRDEIGLSPEAEKVIVLTQKDLAERLSIAEEVIVVQSIEPVTWPDASLGCPEPGQLYAQVLTPGFRVIVDVDGQSYEYHTGTLEPIILCREEGSTMEDTVVPGTAEPAGAVEPSLEALVAEAREDLAQKLGVPTEQITTLEAKAVVWPDSSLGCPQPGMNYLQVLQDGALILLGFEDNVYEYHSGGNRAPFLCEQPLKPEKESLPQLELPVPTPGDENQ